MSKMRTTTKKPMRGILTSNSRNIFFNKSKIQFEQTPEMKTFEKYIVEKTKSVEV